jgi:hypothetical protein
MGKMTHMTKRKIEERMRGDGSLQWCLDAVYR